MRTLLRLARSASALIEALEAEPAELPAELAAEVQSVWGILLASLRVLLQLSAKPDSAGTGSSADVGVAATDVSDAHPASKMKAIEAGAASKADAEEAIAAKPCVFAEVATAVAAVLLPQMRREHRAARSRRAAQHAAAERARQRGDRANRWAAMVWSTPQVRPPTWPSCAVTPSLVTCHLSHYGVAESPPRPFRCPRRLQPQLFLSSHFDRTVQRRWARRSKRRSGLATASTPWWRRWESSPTARSAAAEHGYATFSRRHSLLRAYLC